jgi:hypothetical protein
MVAVVHAKPCTPNPQGDTYAQSDLLGFIGGGGVAVPVAR